MEVGHPVTTENGSHGIVAMRHKDGTTTIDLIGGTTIRTRHSTLKSYFDNPMPEASMDAMVKPEQSTREQILSIIKAAGDVRLSADEIYSRGSFAGKAQVANELYVLYRKHAVIGREKYDAAESGRAVYKYWLVPGAKLPENPKKEVSEKQPEPILTSKFTVLSAPVQSKSNFSIGTMSATTGIGTGTISAGNVVGTTPAPTNFKFPTYGVCIHCGGNLTLDHVCPRDRVKEQPIKSDENEKHNLATLKDLFARRAAIDAAIVALKKVMYWDDEVTHG